jgi:hypothetical protein
MKTSLIGMITLVLPHGHSLQFGIEDLSGLWREAGFEEIKPLSSYRKLL